ncbi:hypothetical protein FQN54_001588 [Arachnomyces sp. PD_36]|nr:hypothetical protein FQN54_001588 [Arachnomyces sp. PD_36]
MIYFIYHLNRDEFKIPWAFLVLTTASILTLLNLTVTAVFDCCFRLSPLVSLVNNSILLVLWIASISLLSVSMKGTLYHSCSVENWGNDTGMMVCRIYKALFTFTVTGFVSQVLSVGLDFFTRKAKNRRAAYNVMNDEGKDRESVAESFTSASTNSNDPKVDALNAFGTSRPAPQPENPPSTYQETIAEGYYPAATAHAWTTDTPVYQDPPVQEYTAYRPDRYQGVYNGGYRR